MPSLRCMEAQFRAGPIGLEFKMEIKSSQFGLGLKNHVLELRLNPHLTILGVSIQL